MNTFHFDLPPIHPNMLTLTEGLNDWGVPSCQLMWPYNPHSQFVNKESEIAMLELQCQIGRAHV